MGAQPSRFGPFQDSVSFKPDKTSQSLNKKIKNIHVDESMFPESGLFVIGTEYVENYSQDGHKLVAHSKCPSTIISSSISTSNSHGTTMIAIASLDNKVYLLNASTMYLLGSVTIGFKATDLELAGYEVKASNAQYFEKIAVESVLTPLQDSFFVGLSNGFLKEYSIKDGQELRVYSPLTLECPKKAGEETKEVIIDDIPIAGALSLNYGTYSELIFVNHKRSLVTLQGHTVNMEDTIVSVYKRNESQINRFKVKGDILASKVLDHRNLYLVLTSSHSELYIFNFYKDSPMMKVSFDILKNPNMPLYFTGMTVHEFAPDEKNQPASQVFEMETPTKELIDGDVIVGIEHSGSMLIAKLPYLEDKKKLSFAPLKYINAKGESKVPENNTIMVSKSAYLRSHDKFVFSDQHNEVVMISNLMKTIFSESTQPNTDNTAPQRSAPANTQQTASTNEANPSNNA